MIDNIRIKRIYLRYNRLSRMPFVVVRVKKNRLLNRF